MSEILYILLEHLNLLIELTCTVDLNSPSLGLFNFSAQIFGRKRKWGKLEEMKLEIKREMTKVEKAKQAVTPIHPTKKEEKSGWVGHI